MKKMRFPNRVTGFLAGALLAAGSHMIFMTHGHLFNTEQLPPLMDGDILLHGHTHLSVCEDHGSYVYMNPGSVSLPKQDHPRGCMTFDGNEFLWKTLDGEIYRRHKLS